MEQLVAELKKSLPFKQTTDIGDIVLIAAKHPKMLVYALVGDIVRDRSRRDEWWHVTLHVLSVPIQTLVWTLRTPQLTGQEIFTMGGEGRFIQAVNLNPSKPRPPSERDDRGNESGRPRSLRIVK